MHHVLFIVFDLLICRCPWQDPGQDWSAYAQMQVQETQGGHAILGVEVS